MSIPNDLHEIVKAVSAEAYIQLKLAIKKHGLQEDVSIAEQFLITSEEYGEIAKEILDRNIPEARLEIRQTVAMLIKLDWLLEKESR